MDKHFSLDDVISISEAAALWHKKINTVQQAIYRNSESLIRKGLIRKSYTEDKKNVPWIITKQAMKELYGEQPNELQRDKY